MQRFSAVAISSDSGTYIILERVLTMGEIAALRCASFAMTLNCGFLTL
jgi:hypothetical protein